MDIHRCRFVPYNPQAINALAFSHPPSTDLQGRGVPTLRLAIGRANGDIEIWNPLKGAWFQETILRGGKDRSIEGLVWTLDPSETDFEGNETPGKLRLFSIGYSSVVTEWDLEQGRPARHSSGNYGEIWCLAVQPRWKATQKGKDGKLLPPAEGEFSGQHLAVGCADGTIVILSTADRDLKYLRTMRPSTKRSRVLNISFQNRNTIVAAYADSSIRIFDIRNGKLLRTVTLGKGPNKAAKELLVWSVKCLPDGTIVSGDSAGEIRFWDAKNYSLIQRIQSHQADVLDIAVSADGETVVSAGADQRTAIYKLKAPEKGAKMRRWAEVMHRRYHTHDVKALAVYETKDISVIVSGGLDTIPVVVPLRNHGKELHRKLPSLPRLPQLSSSPSSRLLMSWWDREVSIWRVFRPSASVSESLEPQHRLLAKILFQGEENLTSVALSSDGKFLVAATISQVKAFSLSPKEDGDRSLLRVNKLEIPPKISEYGAKEVAISPDCQWLCLVQPDNVICMASIDDNTETPGRLRISPGIRKLRRIQRNLPRGKVHHGTLGAYDSIIRCIAFSVDSKILACGDLAGFIDVWVLEGEKALLPNEQTNDDAANSKSSDDDTSDEEGEGKDLHGLRWVRPHLESPTPRLKSGILLMSFRPPPKSQFKTLNNIVTSSTSTSHSFSSDDDRLVVLTSEHHLSEFNILKGKFTDWSRRNPKAYLPEKFTVIKDRAMGTLWDSSGRLWLYGPSWLWMFDLSQDFSAPCNHANEKKSVAKMAEDATKEPPPSKKRKRGEGGEGKIRAPNTGAGDKSYWQNDIGLGRKIRKVIGNDGSKGQWIPLDRRKPVDMTQIDDEEIYQFHEPSNMSLGKFRREERPATHHDHKSDVEEEEQEKETSFIKPTTTSSSLVSNGMTPSQVAFAVVIRTKSEAKPTVPKVLESKPALQETVAEAPDLQDEKTPETKLMKKSKARSGRRWWHTFKYREILGVVPLSQGHVGEGPDDGTQDGGVRRGLEVAVVERPMWDVPLPGRYIRDYE
ncbi:U3 small nucleolar RNA-associated protein [Emydomyces testavorans]|uniref:U3 small nucleolar RNA-associated protein n=1 Tax=Emydomyces testavorans TaxID=2070801 RepID=A0AAF0DIY3_9EURO|nr:U3 small nucleolar RNA-associated protein [Emydomyces testavorans]